VHDPLADFRLEGRVAIVTGASSGLGARFARVLDQAGASVVLVARRADRIESLAQECENALAVAVDLASPDAADAIVAATIAHFGAIDILVNNAGMTHVKPAIDESVEDFRHVVEVNLVAPFALSRLVARHAIASERKASIVNIASVLGLVGAGKIPQAGYAASKGGVVNLTRELAAQWGTAGVRVNAIAPGWFRSEMTNDTMFETEAGQRVMARAPLGRPGREHELDGALLFLASDASSFVTGQVLCVDGGWTAI